MDQHYRDVADIESFLTGWIVGKLKETGACGGVVGLSGGVDSSALAALLRKVCGRDGLLGVIMPIHSIPDDEEDALLLASALDIATVKVDLTSTFDLMSETIKSGGGGLSEMAAANIKPRLRMTALYSLAQSRNFLVFGGSNKDELLYGYFTKHGDSGVDLLPFGELVKGEVFALARRLGVPGRIVDKAPSAGLWKGQTDESEMGVTYEALDRYILTGEGDPASVERIRAAERRTEHKRNMPPIAPLPGAFQ